MAVTHNKLLFCLCLIPALTEIDILIMLRKIMYSAVMGHRRDVMNIIIELNIAFMGGGGSPNITKNTNNLSLIHI